MELDRVIPQARRKRFDPLSAGATNEGTAPTSRAAMRTGVALPAFDDCSLLRRDAGPKLEGRKPDLVFGGKFRQTFERDSLDGGFAFEYMGIRSDG